MATSGDHNLAIDTGACDGASHQISIVLDVLGACPVRSARLSETQRFLR